MKTIFTNIEPYAAPEIALVEVMIERGFAQTGGETSEPDPYWGEWDN